MFIMDIITTSVLLLLTRCISAQDPSLVENSLEGITFYSERILQHISNFHKYEYDDFVSPVTTIENGRKNMYSVGNQVAFWRDVSSRRTVITYDEIYNLGTNTLGSAAVYPFTVLWLINESPNDNTNMMEVRSFTGSTGEGRNETFEGILDIQGYHLTYKVYQLFDVGTPTICEVYFFIENKEAWNSISPFSFTITSTGFPPYTITNTITIEGNHQGIMLGYCLYSKANGLRITELEVEAALSETLRIIIESDSPNRPSFPPPTPRFRPDTVLMVEEIMSQVENVATEITEQIPSWYNYEYDSPDSEIEDGGNDIYDFGNRVRFKRNQDLFVRALYDEVYYFPDYQSYSRSIHPFISLMWIKNLNGTEISLTLQVDGNVGADQDGEIALYSDNNYQIGQFTISYEVFHIHSAQDPSISEVYFTVHSTQVWNSVDSYSFEVVSFSDETDELVNSVQVSGRPQRILMGYMLLSKQEGKIITEDEVRQGLFVLVSAFGSVSQVTPSPIPETSASTSSSLVTQYSNSTDFQVSSGGLELEQILAAYSSVTNVISNRIIRGWHSYEYDDDVDPINSIINGGFDMYNVGNQFIFYEDDFTPTQATYDTPYRFRNYDVIASTSHPFLGLLWIKNAEAENHSYTITVSSTFGKCNKNGTLMTYNGTLYQNNFFMKFSSFQVYDAGSQPSICEIYFMMYNRKVWNSTISQTFESTFSSTPNSAFNSLKISGAPQNVLMGYLLLSRKNGGKISGSQIKATLRRIPFSLGEASPMNRSINEEVSSTQMPQPQIDDLFFLPSCSVAETIHAMLQCEQVFESMIKYYGPGSCINTVDCAVNCLANQLEQCTHGNNSNVVDSLNLPSFNTKFLIDYLRNLSDSSSSASDAITTFCHHAPMGLFYPHTPSINFEGCAPNFFQKMLTQFTTFYHDFLWARDRRDICRAVQRLQTEILEDSETLCLIDTLNEEIYSENMLAYLDIVKSIALKTIRNFQFRSCSDEDEDFKRLDYIQYNQRRDLNLFELIGESNTLDLPLICRNMSSNSRN